jgi:hypothetical protein
MGTFFLCPEGSDPHCSRWEVIARMGRLAQDNFSGIPAGDNDRKSTGGKAFRGIGEGSLLPREAQILLIGACVITLMCQYSSVCPIRSLWMTVFLPV